MRTAARTAFFMVLLTFLSKVIGFLRELLLANYYGAGYIIDAYVMATAIPSIIFGGILASISTAYMPMFSKIMELKNREAANRFTSEVINLSLIVSIFSCILGIVFSDQIVTVFASGFQGETAELTSFYIKVTFSFVIFSSSMNLMEAFLQYKGVFLPQVVVGYIQNGFVIAGIIVSAYSTHYVLAFGWLFGYAARLIILILQAKKAGFNYSFSLEVSDTAKQITMLAFPVFIGSSLNQINMFVDKTLASGLTEGSVSALNYSGILVTMISSLTISILVTISYPKLTQASTLNDEERFSDILSTGINLIGIIAIPCSLGAILYHKMIVQIIYERGAFDAIATSLTSTAFLCYSLGLFFTSINSLLTQAYYSMHNMRTPMIFASIGVIINVMFNLILIKPMAHNGLALATSISAFATTVLLYMDYKYKYSNIKLVRSRKRLSLILLCGTISVCLSWIPYKLLMNLSNVNDILIFSITILLAALIYLALLVYFKVDEIRILKQIIHKK